jgi:hypothetical protein
MPARSAKDNKYNMGGFKCTCYASICIVLVFSYDTLMMVAEATETCR